MALGSPNLEDIYIYGQYLVTENAYFLLYT